MSAICVIVNFDGAPVDPDVLRKMAEQAAYRGPDGIRYWISGNVGFAYLALHATTESMRERQPLVGAEESLCLAADARLDNRDELISELTGQGCLLPDDPTDSGLILAAYRAWGVACPEHLIGDFAFAIWDGGEGRLFCARDALGVKLIHYARRGQTLCVASEAQQILQHPAMPRRLDELAAAEYLASYCDDEEHTMFAGIRRLPPAHHLAAGADGVPAVKRYWDLDPHTRVRYRHDGEYAAHFLSVFRRAVTDRLRTPAQAIGVFMSGGLDSCSVAALAQHVLAAGAASSHLVALSYAFDRLKTCDERQFSQLMASELGIELRYLDAEQHWLLGDPAVYRPSLETPFMYSDALDGQGLAILRKCGGRVVLTGQGGDSLVGGSSLIYADQVRQGHLGALVKLARRARVRDVPFSRALYAYILRPMVPVRLRTVVHRLRRGHSGQDLPPWISPHWVRRTGLRERVAECTPSSRYRSLSQQAIYGRLLHLGGVARALRYYERIGASYAIEARHPFLDRRLVEYVMSIPAEQLYDGSGTKLVLRRATTGILPTAIRLRRDKTDLSGFYDLAIREKEVSQVRALLEKPLLARLGMVDAEKLRLAYERYRTGQAQDADGILWAAISLERWLRHYQYLISS